MAALGKPFPHRMNLFAFPRAFSASASYSAYEGVGFFSNTALQTTEGRVCLDSVDAFGYLMQQHLPRSLKFPTRSDRWVINKVGNIT